jgi:hypothetical protein
MKMAEASCIIKSFLICTHLGDELKWHMRECVARRGRGEKRTQGFGRGNLKEKDHLHD